MHAISRALPVPSTLAQAVARFTVAITLPLLLLTSCGSTRYKTLCGNWPVADAEEQARFDGRVVASHLMLTRVDFTFDGTFAEAVRSLPGGRITKRIVLPIAYPTQNWPSRHVHIDVTDESVWEILRELGRQAGTGEPVIAHTFAITPHASATYERPPLSPEEAAMLPQHARAAVREEIRYRKALLEASMQDTMTLFEQGISASVERQNTMLVCVPAPALVDIVIEEARAGDDNAKRAAIGLLRDLFPVFNGVFPYRVWTPRTQADLAKDDFEELRLAVHLVKNFCPEPVESLEELEAAKATASTYLRSLLSSENLFIVDDVERSLPEIEQKLDPSDP